MSGLLAVAIAAWLLTPGSASAACPSMQFFGVRGSGERSGFGHTIGQVLSAINHDEHAGVGNRAIEYWAVDVHPWEPKYFPNYMRSVNQGERNLADAIRSSQRACPSRPIVLAGYSQGAEVIDHWLSSGADRTSVAAVALFGDPRFNPHNGAPINQGSYNHRLYGVSWTFFPPIGGFGGVERYPASRRSWVRSYCADHDQICNTSSLAALIACHKWTHCAHMFYSEMKIGGELTYTQAAAGFLIGRARAAMPHQAPPPDSGPLPPAPGPGDGGGGPVAPPPTDTAAGLAETAGGVAHTWTDPSSAGGTQGPSIASGQTIHIACKLQGFRVADGNTWWYRIASVPWNSNYYVSADAFFNNGRTSGSLIGTPFVDPDVTDCQSPPPPPPSPAPIWTETVGGNANTWTNPANAGGYQGPTIPALTTVQIACRLPGFRVADGNTWWYRIASAPWNGNYYVSADAFYNNGHTSGSLIGTPFVDPAVASC